MNIFIHRRDLRIHDNTTMEMMFKKVGAISPIFIFTPEQISNNPYFSSNLVQFLCESIRDLNRQYEELGSNLSLFYGDIIPVLESIHKATPIKNLGFNCDYSPYSKKRDSHLQAWCKNNGIKCWYQEDMLLVNIMSGPKNYPREKPYVTFTHFKNYQMENFTVRKPNKSKIEYVSLAVNSEFHITLEYIDTFYTYNPNLLTSGNQELAKQTLHRIDNQSEYDVKRGFLAYQTSRLSPFINLGLLSIREVYRQIGKKFGLGHGLITELYWRDFYYNILYHFPHVVGNDFNNRYTTIKWDNNKTWFEKWCNGTTGFPVVDACMTELNTTGYMHNRGRMIVANFLTKLLFIDWRWGEKYFAQNLLDYNISANNGGWQWSANTGTDVGAFNRIFNPWTQVAKWDKGSIYIKKWLPVLRDVDSKYIEKWDKYHTEYTHLDYPQPMIDYKERRAYGMAKYAEYKT